MIDENEKRSNIGQSVKKKMSFMAMSGSVAYRVSERRD
jgi:hypothetical protein